MIILIVFWHIPLLAFLIVSSASESCEVLRMSVDKNDISPYVYKVDISKIDQYSQVTTSRYCNMVELLSCHRPGVLPFLPVHVLR